jgi:hypothetical protein
MPHLPHREYDQLSDDEEPTNPRASVLFALDAVRFRCTLCLHDIICENSGGRAPLCVSCRRYMAPVNEPRGQA